MFIYELFNILYIATWALWVGLRKFVSSHEQLNES